MKSLDLNVLNWFCEIVDAGSVTGAAKALGVSAPTLSRNLSQLEQQLGQQLIHRSARRFQMTIEGERYYNALKGGFVHLNEQIDMLGDNGVNLQGSIRISCPESMATDYLHEWVVEFLQLYPDVDVNVSFALNDQQFIEDQLDLSIVVPPPTQPRLTQKKLLDTPMWVAASPDFIKKFGEPKTPLELVNFDLLSSDPRKGWAFVNSEGRFELSPSPRYVISSMRAIVDAATRGLGVVYAPVFYLNQAVEQGRLVRILKDYPTEMRHIYMVHADRKLLPTRVRVFKEFIEVCMRRMALDKRTT